MNLNIKTDAELLTNMLSNLNKSDEEVPKKDKLYYFKEVEYQVHKVNF